MKDEILQQYQKIADKISEEDFLQKMADMKKEYEDVSFMNELDLARMIVGEYINEKNKPLSGENTSFKIADLETGKSRISIIGRVMHISNAKKFTKRNGKEGKVLNLILADDTGEIRTVFWTENIKLVKKIKEGDIIKINNVDVKDGYRSKEVHLNPRSTIKKLSKKDFKDFPKYEEDITNISDIKEDMQVNIIARIIRIPRIRKFDRNGGEGKVLSLELEDETGKIAYTLWNNDVDLVDSLELEEGDSVKILSAQSRSRNGEISLTHYMISRIVKGEYDVPEHEEKIMKIGDAHEERNVTVMGVVTKIQDTINFERNDGSTGAVKSIEIADDTGKIRITLWNEDTKLKISKGDIIKINGGNVEFDEYSPTGYRINTNWNTRIIVNPESDGSLIDLLKEYKKHLEPVKIGDLQDIDEEGEELDIVGRIISLNEPREFKRDDGTVGMVRSVEIADGTGVVRTSFWDDKASTGMNIGDEIRLENARTRLGLYNVELSIGKTSRVMKPSDDEIKDIPSLDELEEMIFTTKKIHELEEDERNTRILARIIDLYEPNEFQRDDGTMGMVRSAEIADESGIIRVSLWDEMANVSLNIGDAIKIENPRINFRNDKLELSIGRTSNLNRLKESETEDIPSFKELEEKIYKNKKIDEIEEEDRNVKIKGEISEVYSDRILYPMCSNCNKRLELVDEAYICDFCGEEIEDPNYLMIIPTKIEDETAEIRATFFRKQAEKLIGITSEQAQEIINKTGDEGSIAEKAQDLIGTGVVIVADANFDEYNEELRLNVKKILT
ncbi:MAG: OB-fold nucleic acid binding domain-containing protein [Methanomicrobiales archaeon]